MAVTYQQTDTASDLSGNIMEVGGDGAAGSVSLAAASGGGTATLSFFTPPGLPGTDGATGNYTIEINMTVANTGCNCDVRLHRVNSAGTRQTSSSFSTPQAASVALKTFTFTAQSLGTWTSGDRLELEVRDTNTNAHGSAQGFTWDTDTTNAEVITPFTAPVIVVKPLSALGVG